ncbi:MAG: hypothetical protein CSA74_01425 [Rhodobacterales bacterium]|nr:MAG: hypothetical protein CSA74_01425 [Rhodobacterales bacterium]
MPLRLLNVAALLGIPVIGLVLWAWGQPIVSTSGEIRLWVNSIWSPENSQQVADWYTLSHMVHGLLLGLIGKTLLRRSGFAPVYLVAIATGVGWEIIEHTHWVLHRFRAVTLYQGYIGDTVLNATMDYVFMMCGFFLASRVRPWPTFGVIVAMELTSGFMARDNLTLTTLNTLFPNPAIQAWQNAINPLSKAPPPEPATAAGK